MTRFVVARLAESNESFWGYVPVTHPLPDAEHIHLTRLPDGTWTAEDADDRLRNAIAAHRYLGSLDVMRPIYDTLPVQMRSIVMHVLGEHDDPIGCYEHCALCIAVRSPRRVDVEEAGA